MNAHDESDLLDLAMLAITDSWTFVGARANATRLGHLVCELHDEVESLRLQIAASHRSIEQLSATVANHVAFERAAIRAEHLAKRLGYDDTAGDTQVEDVEVLRMIGAL